MKPDILFSVIMALRDGKEWLPRGLDALRGQQHKAWECLIQDGASGDGGPEYAQSLGDARIQVQSAPDDGVYHAWNLALERARGEWLLFLGADDFLPGPEILARAARELAQAGPGIMFAQGGLQLGRQGRAQEILVRSRADIFRFFTGGMPLLTPAVFFRRQIFADGAFDPSYKIAGDFAFAASRLTPGNLLLLPFTVAYMERGGLSSSLKNRALLQAERKRVLAEELKPRAADLIQYCIDTLDDTSLPYKP